MDGWKFFATTEYLRRWASLSRHHRRISLHFNLFLALFEFLEKAVSIILSLIWCDFFIKVLTNFISILFFDLFLYDYIDNWSGLFDILFFVLLGSSSFSLLLLTFCLLWCFHILRVLRCDFPVFVDGKFYCTVAWSLFLDMVLSRLIHVLFKATVLGSCSWTGKDLVHSVFLRCKSLITIVDAIVTGRAAEIDLQKAKTM